ncbi:hypothetical protein AVEN_31999-1, partial [Araneus ventricosus]
SAMDTTADTAYPKIRFRNGLRTCSVCETPGRILFRIPPDENRYKKWFSALKWNVPPEKLKYILANAKVCDRHFSEACFTSTLKERLIKFACPHITEDLPSTTSDNLSALPSPASVEVSDTEPSCSTLLVSSPTASTPDTNGRLQVTPKTKKIKTLLSSVSKLRKRLYENRTSSRLLGQLQAKLADKPDLFKFIQSQLRMQCRSIKGRRWSAKEKSFALNIYLHSPSAYRILRKFFAFPSKATLHR